MVAGLAISEYKRKYAYGEDYGTSQFKFGPVAEKPLVIDNRGLLLAGESRLLLDIFGVRKEVVVGPELPKYLGSIDDVGRYLVYPMRDGLVEKDDERAWRVLYEITRYGFETTKPKAKDFDGFFVTAALSAIAPDYMYQRIFEIHARLDAEEKVVKAVTIIPQPLAVAIAEKTVTCVVVESGHGNTQITPISMYPIRNAIVALNRGGAEADAIAAEILRDLGYEDRAREEKFVRQFKEAVGLIPRDLNQAIEKARREPERFRTVFSIPGTVIQVDMGNMGWARFLIGEIIFNPEHEIFESYYKRGMPRPKDTVVGGERVRGTMPLVQAITHSVSRTSTELQPALYKDIILSGGNFAWKVPQGLEDVAVDSATKVALELKRLGIESNVRLVSDPLYSVWKGTIVYSIAVPEDVEWDWKRREGWYKRGVHY
ncbi:hypothetical protein [Thermofilum pendens]|uniref:Actin/actin family protein n=1 Tax=Thermofilum pendens (strain DSM 2475 / Hrk 5) TaxID=368408 RepID=A1RXK6_THEPD|nr:actin/actin family protein [Thermofilum pendens Hrk 5]